MRRNLLLLLGLLAVCSLLALRIEVKPEVDLARLLGWIPRGTETVIVTKGPFHSSADTASVNVCPLCRCETLPTLSPTPRQPPNELGKILAQSRWCVSAVTKFRPGGAFEGCDLV